ncbi:MAG: hypothetical protein P3C10_11900 [Gemmatimonadota bacterium]|nr:hypothetical protein [Gemmatimonadota bacterium]
MGEDPVDQGWRIGGGGLRLSSHSGTGYRADGWHTSRTPGLVVLVRVGQGTGILAAVTRLPAFRRTLQTGVFPWARAAAPPRQLTPSRVGYASRWR